MRRSTTITLTLLGAVSIGGCGNRDELRNYYQSREDCVADYSEAQCQPASHYSGGYGGYYGGGYYGPGYPRDRALQEGGRYGRAASVETVRRGGFGSSISRYTSSSS